MRNQTSTWRSAAGVVASALLLSGSACSSSSVPQEPAQPAPDAGEAQDVRVWLTTPDQSQLLASQTLARDPEASVEGPVIEIDESISYQTIDGFGAAFTNASTLLIQNRLDESQRAQLLRSLFSADEGIALSVMRHVAGSSEFAERAYTYDDLPPGEVDAELSSFSLEPDLVSSIPVLEQALAINPDLKLMASLWSPPAWMKTSGSLVGGELLPEYYDAWARYLVRIVEEFAAIGIRFEALTVQNEPLFVPSDYPGMFMSAEVQAVLVGDHLGPALEAAGLETEIFIFDHNWALIDYAFEVLADEEARAATTGTAFHCYQGGPEAQSIVHDAFPDKAIWMTECTGLVSGVFDLDFRWQVSNLIIGAVRNWASASLMWNLALDETSGPRIGGCANCRGVVTIDQSTGNVTYNAEYYVLGHATHAADPGAVRISSEGPEAALQHVAFRNPNGELGLVVLNNGPTDLTFLVRAGADAFPYTLPAGAAATFRWPSDDDAAEAEL